MYRAYRTRVIYALRNCLLALCFTTLRVWALTGGSIDQLPDFLEGRIGIRDITHDDDTGRYIAEAQGHEWVGITGRTRCQRREIDRTQITCALKYALAQRGLFHVAKFDHLFIDGEKPLVEFKPIGIKAIFGPAVVQLHADIRDNGNRKECDCADGVRCHP